MSGWLRALLALTFAAPQGPAEIRFVETSVDLRRDGSAVVLYTVQWAVRRGELHGFFFEGNDRLRVGMAADDSYAVDDAGRRYGLSITEVSSGRWDIVLAGGQGVSSGTVTYVFAFTTDFASAGYLASTTADDGRELAVFNWSPVRWDEASNQEHYTLHVLTPYVLPSGIDPRQFVEEQQAVLTEPFVNQKFRIDYQRGEADRLRLVFHRENPGNRYDMRTQIYLPAEWFTLAAPGAVPTPRPSQRQPLTPTEMEELPGFDWFTGLAVVVLLGMFVLIIGGKHRSMVAAHEGLDAIRWDRLDWTAPKLVLSTFRKPGKVCRDLTPTEVGFYLGLPFKRIVSAMLNSMVAEGFLEIVRRNPLLASVRRKPDLDQLDEYERMFFESFADDGELSQSELEDLMNQAVENVRRVDASIVAIAERLDVTTILTTDRRHFGVIRPSHTEAFVLAP